MEKTALIILDFIIGVTESESFRAFFQKHPVISRANQLIAYGRKNKWPIIFVKVGFSDNYAELANRSPLFTTIKQHGGLKLSEKSTDFNPKLDYHPNDIVVVKHRISAFYSTSLEAILNANNIHHVILCGVSTNWAVEGAARDAHDRNYVVTIAKDACASNNLENQEKSLSILERIAHIKSVEDICYQSKKSNALNK